MTVRLPVADPRSCEERLAGLWVDGVVEVLDGVVLRWPAEVARPRLRPLQNVPRLAALPEGVWGELTAGPSSGGARLVPVSIPALSPGSSVILAFCTGADTEALPAELSRDGADVASTVVDATWYAALRTSDRSSDPSGL
ncbi:hypothetical protein AB0K00_54115 [Dactylosporangium sp. NPDC049525]|uniref:hypothetical protein n=1 Tax=Dactylosporangium sp. NPDC049525 TaxID=3154730 RepID=UPI00344A75E6